MILNESSYLPLPGFLERREVSLKVEGWNPAGSIKLKTALSLIEESERSRQIRPGTRVIESSSGNLGIALAIVCGQRRIPFTCVTDPNTSRSSFDLMKAYGATVVVVDKRDDNGGFLGTRIERIKSMLASDPRLFWTNQYANPANPLAHYRWTAPAIVRDRPACRWLFVGAGTTGTLMGCARYMREHAPHVGVVAVDAVGSVTFGGEAGRRSIPGLGSSRRPEILEPGMVDTVELVSELETVRTCREVSRRYGMLVGGSTGTVLAGLRKMEARLVGAGEVVAIAPDLGERYLDTIYNDAWCLERFGHRVDAAPVASASERMRAAIAQPALASSFE